MKSNPKKLDHRAPWHTKTLDFRSLMGAVGLSGADLARRIDVSENTVSGWMVAHHEPPGAVLAYLRLLRDVRAAST